MILVTVGTHPQGFERLVQPMDQLAVELEERVIIQYGSSKYIPHYTRAFDFATSQEMERLTAKARVVVCHAAAGAIILAMQLDRPFVLVPRLKKFGEHLDDHQLQLARALEAQQKTWVVYDPSVDNLRQAIRRSNRGSIAHASSRQLVQDLKARLAQWEAPDLRPTGLAERGPGL